MKNLIKSMVLDGIGASSLTDSSAEQMDIEGADISSLTVDGVFNYEHSNASPNDIVGSISCAKKIFSEKDCSDDRQKMYWDQTKAPFIYVKGELFNDEGHPGAQALASMIRYYNKRQMPIVPRFSIEGSTLEREGNVLTKTICRRVSLTIKPCNKSCVTGVVFDSEDEKSPDILSNLKRSESPEFPILGKHESDGSFIDDDYDESLEILQEITDLDKAIAAGGYDTAPSTLSNGSALMAEEFVDDKKKKWKNTALAAYRDFRFKKSGNFKDFLKSKLPEASDSFINHFVDAVDDLKLKKTEELVDRFSFIFNLTKAAGDVGMEPNLKQLPESTLPKGSVKFHGRHVSPGEIEVTSGMYSGSKLPFLGEDKYSKYVLNGEEIQSLPHHTTGKTHKVNKNFEILNAPVYSDASKHSNVRLNRSPHQLDLIHGINFSEAPKTPSTGEGISAAIHPGKTGWITSLSGKVGYIKPSIETESFSEEFPTAKRETVYHNLARDFFNLGEHVPNTATFTHPGTGEEMSIMERVHDSSHHNENDPEHKKMLRGLNNNGTLDKLGLMDMILGNNDRHSGNYMLTENAPYLHHIDNGLILNSDQMPKNKPDYITYTKKSNPYISPHAQAWVLGLDENKMANEMNTNGVPEELINQSINRLRHIKSHAANPGFNWDAIMESTGPHFENKSQQRTKR